MTAGRKMSMLAGMLLAAGGKFVTMAIFIIAIADEYRGISWHPWQFYALLSVLVVATSRLENLFHDELKKTLAPEES